jgi:hypothetical protein
MYRLSLQAITMKNRAEVSWDLKEALRLGGAWILNFQIFSNKATGIQFELYFETISILAELLSQLDIGFQDNWRTQFDTLIGLYEYEPEVYREKEIFGLLNVTFEHDEPELIIPVPMVPG